NKIVIATAAPASGPLAEMGQAVRAVTAAFFDEVNSSGGVYNRKLELKSVETSEDALTTRASLDRALASGQIFAMTSACIAGAEKEVVPLIADRQVPLIGPITLYPQTVSPLNRYVFYLLSGLTGQTRALVDFAAKQSEGTERRPAVVYPKTESSGAIVAAINDQAGKSGMKTPRLVEYAVGALDQAQTVARLKQDNCDVLFFLGASDEALLLMREADKLGWAPVVCLPNGGGAEIFSAAERFDGRVYFAFPASPSDQTLEAKRELQALIDKYHLSTRHLSAQISAYSAAKLLVDCLRKIGRNLSREKLVQS